MPFTSLTAYQQSYAVPFRERALERARHPATDGGDRSHPLVKDIER